VAKYPTGLDEKVEDFEKNNIIPAAVKYES